VKLSNEGVYFEKKSYRRDAKKNNTSETKYSVDLKYFSNNN